MIDRTMPASMLMVYSARPGRLGASDAIYRRAASKYYRVDVNDTKHLDFSDLLKRLGVEGVVDTRALRLYRLSGERCEEVSLQFTSDPQPRPNVEHLP